MFFAHIQLVYYNNNASLCSIRTEYSLRQSHLPTHLSSVGTSQRSVPVEQPFVQLSEPLLVEEAKGAKGEGGGGEGRERGTEGKCHVN